jgi:nitrogen regulatory protein PII-like uncharacterized protein
MKISLVDQTLARFRVIKELADGCDDTCLTGSVLAYQNIETIVEFNRERLAEAFETVNI